MSILGSLTGRQFVEDRYQQERDYARQRWNELEAGDLEHVRDRLWRDKASGLLFTPILDSVLHAKFEQSGAGRVSFFTVNTDGELTFFERPERGPQTIEELEEQDAARQRLRDEEEQRHRAYVAAQPRRLLTLAAVEGDDAMPTLRQAAATVIEHGGRLEAKDGELLIDVPERFAEDGFLDLSVKGHVHKAARVVAAGRDVVLAELARESRKPLVDRLPDRQVLAAGGVEP